MDRASYGSSPLESYRPASSTKSVPSRQQRTWQAPFPLYAIMTGFGAFALFVAGLFTWSQLAPIESAVISPGVVSVASFRKTVQHLEGGIVKEILVQDGDLVEEGQLLIKLDDVSSRAATERLGGQYAQARATIARLSAERAGGDRIIFADDLLQQAGIDPSIERVLQGQRDIFESQRLNRDARLSVFYQQIEQTRAEISGFQGQIAAIETQLRLAREEHLDLQGLYQQQLIPRQRMLELQGRIASFEGKLSELGSAIARAQKSMLESESQINELKTQSIAEATQSLRTEQALVNDLHQQLVAAEHVLERTEIRSPIEGTVVDLQVHTNGGVISAGQPLMDVVPSGDELIVEAMVNPDDIEEVEAGMPAHVELTSINRRRGQPIEGEVTHVSADRLVDSQTGVAFYRARIKLDGEAAAMAGERLQAGMGADVFIRTGTRSPFEYLVQPLARSMQLGLREN